MLSRKGCCGPLQRKPLGSCWYWLPPTFFPLFLWIQMPQLISGCDETESGLFVQWPRNLSEAGHSSHSFSSSQWGEFPLGNVCSACLLGQGPTAKETFLPTLFVWSVTSFFPLFGSAVAAALAIPSSLNIFRLSDSCAWLSHLLDDEATHPLCHLCVTTPGLHSRQLKRRNIRDNSPVLQEKVR